MKKLFIILFVSLITMSFLPVRENQNIKEDSVENVECKIRRCNAIAKSTEKRCKRCVSLKERSRRSQQKTIMEL